jgi:hypothetical protein
VPADTAHPAAAAPAAAGPVAALATAYRAPRAAGVATGATPAAAAAAAMLPPPNRGQPAAGAAQRSGSDGVAAAEAAEAAEAAAAADLDDADLAAAAEGEEPDSQPLAASPLQDTTWALSAAAAAVCQRCPGGPVGAMVACEPRGGEGWQCWGPSCSYSGGPWGP